MSKMGNGYGSECHLLRWMGRHRNRSDREILAALGQEDGRIDWLDFHFDPLAEWLDGEWKGLDFIDDAEVQAAWAKFWPQTGNAMNWDAVGWVVSDRSHELLLVEGKAHLGEIASSCGAKGRGREKIAKALDETKQALKAAPASDWLNGYYQYANRLAVLHFLHSHGVQAHLLMIHFVGDTAKSGRECPQSVDKWHDALAKQDRHLGLPRSHALSGKVHKLYLPVCG